MKKIALLSVVTSLVAGAFVAGVAVGKAEPPAKAKFIAVDEVKWDDLGGGPKIAQLTGDYKKGPYTGLLKLPAGFTSPLHSHSGTYEAVEISGTTSHWLKGEDGTKAKKMTPGSYWTFQGKADHVSSCAPGQDCVLFVWQKTKFDFIAGKEDKPAGGAGSGAGSAAKPAGGAGTGSAAKPAGGAGTGSAAKPATGSTTKPGAGGGAGTGGGGGAGTGAGAGSAKK